MFMLDTPHITHAGARPAAVIHLTIPRSQIQQVMGPAIMEVMAAVKAQGAGPAGPVFAHYLSMPSDTFDFEVGVPVSAPVAPAGRVQPGDMPDGRVARTVYQGTRRPGQQLGPVPAMDRRPRACHRSRTVGSLRQGPGVGSRPGLVAH
jgi:hypothetical protein